MQYFKSDRDSALFSEILYYFGITKILYEIDMVMELLIYQFDTCYLCEMSYKNKQTAYMNKAHDELVVSQERTLAN